MSAGLLTTKHEEVAVNSTKLVRLSALALILFFSALSAFAVPPCGCNYCQRFPDRTCTLDGTATTCLEFLIVALCPPLPPNTSANAQSAEPFFAAMSGSAQEPAGCMNPTR